MRPTTAIACITTLVAAFTGCGDDSTATGPEIDPRAISLAVGEVRSISLADAEPLRINGGAAGAEFTLIPVHAAEPGVEPIPLQFSGEQLIAPVGPPMPRVGGAIADLSLATFGASGASATANFQTHLNQLDRDALVPRMGAARAMYVDRSGQRLAASGVPAVGAQVTINTSVLSACAEGRTSTGRVIAVTDHAVIVADEANPAGGFNDTEYTEIATTFDAVVQPVITQNFGAPSDIDANGGRTVIFFTRAVNELTPAGADFTIRGFFFGRDLFARSGPNACAGSNEAELLYVMVPDPNGEVNGNVRTKDFVRTTTPGNLAHLSQYLVNFSRRMFVNNAPGFEETWLNTGLSMIAEELVFYRVSGLTPRQNITYETLVSSQTIEDAANAYHTENLRALMFYLQEPEWRTPYATPGATWQFLRYAADQSVAAEQALWFSLANSQTSGIANIAAATGTDVLTILRAFATAQYTDDAGFAVASPFQHPSWNFRSVLSSLRDDATFPLSTRSLVPGSPLTLALHPGGAAYIRFGIAAGRVGSIRVAREGSTGTGSGTSLPDLSLTLVRTK